jgi:hypothetical protein
MPSSKKVIDWAAACAAAPPHSTRIAPQTYAGHRPRMVGVDGAIRAYITAAGMALGLVAAWAALVQLAA